MKLSQNTLKSFRVELIKFQTDKFRPMPWREPETDGSFDAYKVLVSEVMLQQTQVTRVIDKYKTFLSRFPTVEALASVNLGEVIKVWSGLGYNRRAKYLHDAAQRLQKLEQPWNYNQLISCKGIGSNTAKAVLVYSYNQPYVFVETNVRTVIIHAFFPEENNVPDKEIEAAVSKLIDEQFPRNFYWALMDWGAEIKRTIGNTSRKSSTYKMQSKFEGSLRQIRGNVLRLLAEKQAIKHSELEQTIEDNRLGEVLDTLQKEKLVIRTNDKYSLP